MRARIIFVLGAMLVAGLMMAGGLTSSGVGPAVSTSPDADTADEPVVEPAVEGVSGGRSAAKTGAGPAAADVHIFTPEDAVPMARPADGRTGMDVLDEALLTLMGPSLTSMTSSGGTGSRALSDPGEDPDSATQLHPGAVRMNQSVEMGGSQPTDIDWYVIWLNYTSTQADMLRVTVERETNAMMWCRVFEPLLFDIQSWQWIGAPAGDYVTVVNITSHQPGWYFLQVLVDTSETSTQMDYNILDINVTTVTPKDSNSFFPDGDDISPSNMPANKRVYQHDDHWDFYNASALVVTENPELGEYTDLSVSVDIVGQSTEEHPDPFNPPGTLTMYPFTWGTLLYEDDQGDLISTTATSLTQNSNFQAHGGIMGVSFGVDPFPLRADCYGPYAYVGVSSFCFFLDGSNLYWGEVNAWGEYSVVGLTNTPFYPNEAPYLRGGEVDRNSGYKTQEFNFNVTFFDEDNDPATQVKIVWDDGAKQEYMTLDAGSSDGDTTNGENYITTLTGEDLGEGSHQFHFECQDGQDSGRYPLTGELGPISVSYNTPPFTLGDYYWLSMKEDQGSFFIPILNLFDDVETPQGVKAWVTLPETDAWANSLDSDMMTVDVLNFDAPNGNQTIRISPKPDMHGELDVWVRAQDSQWYSGNVTLSITIDSVNDQPVIETVNDEVPTATGVTYIINEDRWLNITVVASDIDGDTITYLTNATGDLGLVDGKNYMADPNLGRFSFLFDNDMVGTHWVSLMVSDGLFSETTVDMKVTVLNTNDEPTFEGVKDMDVDQDEWLNFTLTGYDEDWADGQEKFTLTNDVEDESDFVMDVNFFISYEKPALVSGIWEQEFYISFHPDNSLIGEYEFEFTLSDSKGVGPSEEMELEVINVNDPPYFVELGAGKYPHIIMEQEDDHKYDYGTNPVYRDEDLTFTAEAKDADLRIDDSSEQLTFTWEFGDGSGPLRGVDLTQVEYSYEGDDRTYMVNLTVEDDEGEAIHTSYEVEVRIEPEQDLDDDGMPDMWELEHEFNRHNPSDASQDADGDGVTNLQEYLDNTDPNDPTSFSVEASEERGEKEKESSDANLVVYYLLTVIVVILVVVVLVFVIIAKKKKAPKAAEGPQQDAPYDPSGGMGGGFSGAGVGGEDSLLGDPSAPPSFSSGAGMGAAGTMAPLGPGEATTAPSRQLPPAETDLSGLGDGSADPLEPLADKTAAGGPPAGAGGPGGAPGSPGGAGGPPGGTGAGGAPGGGAPGFKPPSSPKPAGSGAAGPAGSAPAGSAKCPSCSAAVKPGWFICPSCKNPLN